MITKSKENMTALIAAVLFAVTAGLAIYFFASKSGAERGLTDEKVKTEKMLSEKLALSREIEKLHTDIASFKGKNSELDKSLASLEAELRKRESELNDANGKMQTVSSYKKEIGQLQALRDKLNSEVARLNDQLVVLQSENQSLKNALTQMEASNESLADRNFALTQFIANNYGAEAHKRGDKLTVNARRARQIVLGFDIPMEMTDKLSFSVTSPDGKSEVSTSSKSIYYTVKEDFEFSGSEVVASTTGLTTNTGNSKRVVLTYKPEVKLKKGVYKIDIYADNIYVGSSQLRLK